MKIVRLGHTDSWCHHVYHFISVALWIQFATMSGEPSTPVRTRLLEDGDLAPLPESFSLPRSSFFWLCPWGLLKLRMISPRFDSLWSFFGGLLMPQFHRCCLPTPVFLALTSLMRSLLHGSGARFYVMMCLDQVACLQIAAAYLC